MPWKVLSRKCERKYCAKPRGPRKRPKLESTDIRGWTPRGASGSAPKLWIVPDATPRPKEITAELYQKGLFSKHSPLILMLAFVVCRRLITRLFRACYE